MSKRESSTYIQITLNQISIFSQSWQCSNSKSPQKSLYLIAPLQAIRTCYCFQASIVMSVTFFGILCLIVKDTNQIRSRRSRKRKYALLFFHAEKKLKVL